MNEIKILLKILKCALSGEKWQDKETVDGNKIYSLACTQGINYIIFPVLCQIYEQGNLKITDEEFEGLKNHVSYKMMRYTKKQFSAYSLLAQMKSAGFDYVVLKGDTLAYLYKTPELRMSGDIDVLIDEAREAECCEFLKSKGANIGQRTEDNNERPITHKTAGTIELHIAHNTKTMSEIWLEDTEVMEEETRSMLLFDTFEVKCMGYTDVAINLLLHFIRHYIQGIAHLRMLCDTLLFIDREYENIDKERFFAFIEKLKYTKIFSCMVSIGNRFINYEHLSYDPSYDNVAKEMLSDIITYRLKAGSADSDLYAYYSEKKYESITKKDYKEYSGKIVRKNLLRIVFLDKLTMKSKYPSLRKHSYLLPVFYLHRMIYLVFFRPRKRNEKMKNSREVKEQRRNIIDKLDMI